MMEGGHSCNGERNSRRKITERSKGWSSSDEERLIVNRKMTCR